MALQIQAKIINIFTTTLLLTGWFLWYFQCWTAHPVFYMAASCSTIESVMVVSTWGNSSRHHICVHAVSAELWVGNWVSQVQNNSCVIELSLRIYITFAIMSIWQDSYAQSHRDARHLHKETAPHVYEPSPLSHNRGLCSLVLFYTKTQSTLNSIPG